MVKLGNVLKSFVFVWVLVALIGTFWGGIYDGYGLQNQQVDENGLNIIERMATIDIVQGLNDLQAGIFKVATFSGFSDLLGGLQLSGSGSLQTLGGIFTFPFQIFDIILSPSYYGSIIPPEFSQFLGFMLVITMATIFLASKVGIEL